MVVYWGPSSTGHDLPSIQVVQGLGNSSSLGQKLIQRQLGNFHHGPKTITENESKINNFPLKEGPGSNDFTDEFYQTFTKEMISIVYNLFQEIGPEGTVSNSFYKVSITLIWKPDRYHKKELQTNLSWT